MAKRGRKKKLDPAKVKYLHDHTQCAGFDNGWCDSCGARKPAHTVYLKDGLDMLEFCNVCFSSKNRYGYVDNSWVASTAQRLPEEPIFESAFVAVDQALRGRSVEESDPVNHPPHYTHGGIEVLDAIEAWELDHNYYRANVVKYIARAGKKFVGPNSELEDLRKAQFYLNREIDRITERDELDAINAATEQYLKENRGSLTE